MQRRLTGVCVSVFSGLFKGAYDPEWGLCDLERLDWPTAAGRDGISGVWWWASAGRKPSHSLLPFSVPDLWLFWSLITTCWFLCAARGCFGSGSIWGSSAQNQRLWGQRPITPRGFRGEEGSVCFQRSGVSQDKQKLKKHVNYCWIYIHEHYICLLTHIRP